MIEADRAITELKRQREELKHQLRLEQRMREPNQVKIRTCESKLATLHNKIQVIQDLDQEVRELESTLTMKMMNRYPENKPYRTEYKRELTRARRKLRDIAMRHQPKPKPKRPAYAFS